MIFTGQIELWACTIASDLHNKTWHISVTIDDTKTIYFPDRDKTDVDPHSYGKRADSCPAEQGKYFTAWKRCLLSPHAPSTLRRLCSTVYCDGSLDGANSNKRLWRMLSSQFVLHQGVDTDYALWISLGGMCLFRPIGQNKESIPLKSMLDKQWVCPNALQDGWPEDSCISGKEGVSKGRCYPGPTAYLAASLLDRSVSVFSPQPILLFIYPWGWKSLGIL